MAPTGDGSDIVMMLRGLAIGIPRLAFNNNIDLWGVAVARVLKSLHVEKVRSIFDVDYKPLWHLGSIDVLLWSRNDYFTSFVGPNFGDRLGLDSVTIGAMASRLVIRSTISPEVQQMLDQNFPAYTSSSSRIPEGWHEKFTQLYKEHVRKAAAKLEEERAKAAEAKKRKRKLQELQREYKMHDQERKRVKTELLALARESDPDVNVEDVLKMDDSEAEDCD